MESETIPAPPPHLAAVTTLRDMSLVDVPGNLRRLADDIEAGEHGAPRTIAIVLHADWSGQNRIDTFSFGRVADGAQIACLFSRAARLMEMVVLGEDDG